MSGHKKKWRKRVRPDCACGHSAEDHTPGSDGMCMRVDLNAGGRHLHRFCPCRAYSPRAAVARAEGKETDHG